MKVEALEVDLWRLKKNPDSEFHWTLTTIIKMINIPTQVVEGGFAF